MTDATSVTVVDTRKHPRYKVAIPVDCSTRDLFVSNHVCKGSIRATGRVIWNYDIERGTCHIVPRSGIRFVDMSASDRATLESNLAGLSPTVSARPTPH